MVNANNTLTPKQIARAQKHAELLARPCKTCGNPINSLDKRQVVCSKECGFRSRTIERLAVACVICGRHVLRTTSHLKQFRAACCSDKCQQVWALRFSKGRRIDWDLRSKIARAKWIKKKSDNRRNNSVEYAFFILANNFFNSENFSSDWKRRCSSASAALRQRMTFSRGETKSKSVSFEDVASKRFNGYASLQGKVWEKKCYSTAKNIKWRRRLLNVKRNFLPLTGSTKAQVRQLELWV